MDRAFGFTQNDSKLTLFSRSLTNSRYVVKLFHRIWHTRLVRSFQKSLFLTTTNDMYNYYICRQFEKDFSSAHQSDMVFDTWGIVIFIQGFFREKVIWLDCPCFENEWNGTQSGILNVGFGKNIILFVFGGDVISAFEGNFFLLYMTVSKIVINPN